MAKWFSVVMYREAPLQPPTMALFVMPTTVDPPALPPGGRLLGRVRSSRGEAIDEAMEWLRAEKVVEDMDIIKRSGR